MTDVLTGVHLQYPQERIVFGVPAAKAVSDEVERLGARRVFLTSTASLARLADGPLQQVSAALGDRAVGCYSDIASHSPQSSVIAGAAEARRLGADLLVAVGGGSVIDATKAMVLCLWHGIADEKALDPLVGDRSAPIPSDPAASLRMIAVSTTLSAAEFTPRAGIKEPSRGLKRMFGHAYMVPRVAVLDPAATLTTPVELLASTGIRSVDHAVESWCSPKATPATDPLAQQGLALLLGALPRIVSDPKDLAARQQAQFGMWQAVAASTAGAGSGASHGIGYALGALFDVPHGHTSCVMLPAVLRWNEAANGERQRALAAAIGRGDRPLWQTIAGLVAELGQPGRLRDVGLSEADLPKLAEAALAYSPVLHNPRRIQNAANVMEILRLAW